MRCRDSSCESKANIKEECHRIVSDLATGTEFQAIRLGMQAKEMAQLKKARRAANTQIQQMIPELNDVMAAMASMKIKAAGEQAQLSRSVLGL
jgi:hypothetical protein